MKKKMTGGKENKKRVNRRSNKKGKSHTPKAAPSRVQEFWLDEIHRKKGRYEDAVKLVHYYGFSFGASIYAVKYVVRREKKGSWKDYIKKYVPDLRIEWAKIMLSRVKRWGPTLELLITKVETISEFKSAEEEIRSLIDRISDLNFRIGEVGLKGMLKDCSTAAKDVGQLLLRFEERCGMKWKRYLGQIYMSHKEAQQFMDHAEGLLTVLPGLSTGSLMIVLEDQVLLSECG